MPSASLPLKKPRRKIAYHRRSRLGCGNCKLRKVKCDEGRPHCKSCLSFGVLCDYDSKHATLETSTGGILNIENLESRGSLTKGPAADILEIPLRLCRTSVAENATFQIGCEELNLLDNSQSRTVLTLGNGVSRGIYKSEIVKLAFAHPSMFHAVLAVTLMHDRYLTAGLDVASTNAGVFHWHKAIALFNNKLSGQVLPEEQDVLYGVAAFLSILALYYTEAKTPDEAWPLKPPSSLDLNWLRLSDGKKAVWAIADPLRKDSIFQPAAISHLSFRPGFPAKRDLHSLPAEIIEACGLGITSNLDNNQYYGVALSLAQVIDTDDVYVITMSFISFISHLPQHFLSLMQVKDPGALLLIACWYAKVLQCQVWTVLDRATFELQSICTYLERNHGHNVSIRKALKIPRLLLCPTFQADQVGLKETQSTKP